MANRHNILMLSAYSGSPWIAFEMWNDHATNAIAPGSVVCFWNQTAGGNHDKMWVREVDGNTAAPGISGNAFSTNSRFKVAGVVFGNTMATRSSGTVVWAGHLTMVDSTATAGKAGKPWTLATATVGRADIRDTGKVWTTAIGSAFGWVGESSGSSNNKRGMIVPWRF